MMLRTFLGVCVLAVGLTAALAQEDPIKTRRALMKGNDEHAVIIGKMLKGEAPFDAVKVQAAFAQWADTAAKLPGLFPESSQIGDTNALPAIWEKRPEFDAIIARFTKDIADYRDSATTLAGLRTAVPVLGKDCGDCHQTFRKRLR